MTARGNRWETAFNLVLTILISQFKRYGDSCKRSGGDGMGSGEAKRSRLSRDFPCVKRESENLGITAIGRPICPGSGSITLHLDLPYHTHLTIQKVR